MAHDFNSTPVNVSFFIFPECICSVIKKNIFCLQCLVRNLYYTRKLICRDTFLLFKMIFCFRINFLSLHQQFCYRKQLLCHLSHNHCPILTLSMCKNSGNRTRDPISAKPKAYELSAFIFIEIGT